MLQYLNAIGLIIYVWALVLDLAFRHHNPPWYETWEYYVGPVHCASALLVSGANFLMGLWFFGVLYVGLATAGAWVWWNSSNHRRRRRRQARRAARNL